MAWSYGGDPSSSPKDAIRFEIGDVDSQYPMLQDEEIEYAINQESGILAAAARCCEVIARRLALQPNTTIGKTKIDSNTAAQGYSQLAKELRNKATATTGEFLTAGLPEAYFVRGLHDNNQ
jgi:hypothetical protein